MAKATTEQLEDLTGLMLAQCHRILTSECPTAGELNQVRQFLRDNQIQVTPDHKGVVKLLDGPLPFTEDELEARDA